MRTLLSWSSGKDSAWALWMLRQQPGIEVVGLLTTINQSAGRVAMHGVREALLDQQACAAGLPLEKVLLPWPCSNDDYECAMRECCKCAVQSGVEAIAFGDLFLTEVREYRERQLRGTGLRPLFPIWGLPTAALARQMVEAGVRAKLVCVDSQRMPASFAGRDFDAQLLSELPSNVDPCGENGEFHSFVYAGPVFKQALNVEVGETVTRDQFVYTDMYSLEV